MIEQNEILARRWFEEVWNEKRAGVVPRLFAILIAAPFLLVSAAQGQAPPEAEGTKVGTTPKPGTGFSLEAMRADVQPENAHLIPYFEKVTVEAYRRIGSRNEKWDADAELALTIYAQSLADSHSVFGRPAMLMMIESLKKAIAAGCDDPLLKHAFARTDDLCLRVDFPFERRATYYDSILLMLEKHAYPASRMCLIRLAAARSMHSGMANLPTSGPLANVVLLAAIHDLPEVIKEVQPDGLPRPVFYDLVHDLFQELWLTNTRQVFEEVYPAIVAADGGRSALPLILKGRFYTNLAFSYEKYNDGAEDIAHEALTEAWSKEKTDKTVAMCMMDLTRGDDEFEQWFEACKKIDPHAAYGAKLHYLHPEWGGSLEEMVALGRQCLAEGDWKTQTPMTLIAAHDYAALQSGSRPGNNFYYTKPEVWADLKAVYEGYLQHYPNDNAERSAYAAHAVKCEKWKEAQAILDELGDLVFPTAFGLHDEYYRERAQIAAKAKASAN